MIRRHAVPSDHPAIRSTLEAAFGRPEEAQLVQDLREGGDILFELVAVDADEIVGHIAFSRLWADRYEMFAALAPLSVRPDRQRSGVGASLIQLGLDTAKAFGAHGVLVLGDPAYYGRHGFSSQSASQVRSPYSGLPAFMGLALEPGAFDAPLMVAYPDPFGG